MTFKPEYRGTLAALEADKDKALEWFRDQLIEYAADEGKDHDFLIGLTWKVTAQVQRPPGYSYLGPKQLSKNYYYAFYMPKVGHYGDHRFVIRKNGTIDAPKAYASAKEQHRKHERVNEQDRIFKANMQTFMDRFGETPTEYAQRKKLSSVELSKVAPDFVKVTVASYEWGFTSKRLMKMRDLNGFVGLCGEIKKRIEQYGERMNG